MNLIEHHLDDPELQPFFNDKNAVDDNSRAAALVRQQRDPIHGWPRLIHNLDAYSRVLKDHVNVQGIDIVVTLNETRTPSVIARTFESKDIDPQSCFLCNLDTEQKGILTSSPGVCRNSKSQFKSPFSLAFKTASLKFL